MRVRGFPFGEEVRQFLEQHDVNFVVEQNRDAQLRIAAARSRPACPIEKLRIGPLLRGLPDERAPRRSTGVKAKLGGGGMTFIAKPKVRHPSLQKNALGLTRRDYEGAISTLCAGCGHDSITAAIIQAFWELSIPPHTRGEAVGHRLLVEDDGVFPARRARLQRRARPHAGDRHRRQRRQRRPHLHRRLGRRRLAVDRLGQLSHAIRRNVNMLYMLENNGVYGLTKGQFSASADPGSTSKKGEANTMEAIDGVLLALTLGATFVARSFSGDKAQLVPIIKAGLTHKGFAFIDVISPCVTFNDHEGSTKSYAYTREHYVEVVQADFVPPRDEITAELRRRATCRA